MLFYGEGEERVGRRWGENSPLAGNRNSGEGGGWLERYVRGWDFFR